MCHLLVNKRICNMYVTTYEHQVNDSFAHETIGVHFEETCEQWSIGGLANYIMPWTSRPAAFL
jgi:hypothetical protein